MDILGIYETHLPVRDLDRSIAFYRDKIGLELAHVLRERRVAFFWVGGKEQGMLGLWQATAGPLHMTLHFAFRCKLDAVISGCETLKARGIQPLGFHGEPVTEPVVIGWMPALSLYFKDPDGHSIEMLAVLPDAPDPEFGVQSHSAWAVL
ncbi:VOC family protein [Tropicibacter sp. R16_0]|uniref:VOC family protein n=1 Tax=Tropicibacter sp. R16_0 TaxID=2821102 RepID=UPI001ADC1AC4|nr:VOC family protein [Tropicibacter sp. R16_0]MBO9450983.1 VOC family protein [Tropicibacter sp. R16_0]